MDIKIEMIFKLTNINNMSESIEFIDDGEGIYQGPSYCDFIQFLMRKDYIKGDYRGENDIYGIVNKEIPKLYKKGYAYGINFEKNILTVESYSELNHNYDSTVKYKNLLNSTNCVFSKFPEGNYNVRHFIIEHIFRK